MQTYQDILKNICEEFNINFTMLSRDFIIKLERENTIKYIYGYKFPLNDHALGLILDDKYGTSEILKNLHLPTIDIFPLWNDYNKKEIEKYLDTYKTLIIKPNNGTCGNDVYKITNLDDLYQKIDYLLNKNSPICLSPFYSIKSEYRVIVLNNKVKVIYGKIKPFVIGNGKSTIKELLLEFNKNFYSNKDNLNKINLNINYIPKLNERIEIGYKFNLSNGSNIYEVDNQELRLELESIALKTTNLLNIKFASIDIIQTNDNKLLILEINSGVMMDNFIKLHPNGLKIAKDIYQEAVITMFK